LASSGRELYH